GGDFTSFYDFCSRMHGQGDLNGGINKRAIESLVKAGALDGMAKNRRQMIMSIDLIIDALDSGGKKNIEGQTGLFDMEPGGVGPLPTTEFVLPDADEFPHGELLAFEKEVAEVYLSGHPLAAYEDVAGQINASHIADFLPREDEDSSGMTQEGGMTPAGGMTPPLQSIEGGMVTLLCLISSVKLKVTKSNETMAFVGLEDISGAVEMIVFPRTLAECSAKDPSLVRAGNIVRVDGRISLKDDEVKIICENMLPLSQALSLSDVGAGSSRPVGRPGLYLRCASIKSEEFIAAEKVLRVFSGLTPVYIYETGAKQLVQAPRSLWTAPNAVMEGELRRILGSGNVKLVMN
ncbi:MAG: hypothetical protein FWE86_04305, partial [Oscillospiraceae bacterium]|nr:hypothetical protein [Oscillospiraceae bacterium]